MARNWLCRDGVPILERLEEPVERTQRTFLKLLLGGLVGLVLVIALAWSGWRAYQQWEEGHQVRQATLFTRAGDYKSAALSARRALQLNPNSTGAMRVMAQLAEKAHERVALDWRRKVVQLEPAAAADAIALSSCALQFGDLPLAEKALASVRGAERSTAAYHLAQGRLAKARKDTATAVMEFRQALQTAPGDESAELEYALACLDQSDPAQRDEGERILTRLRNSPAQRAAATRALFVDGVTHHHHPRGLRSLAAELQSYPEALFTDRLLYLDVLRQLGDREYATYLTQIEKDASGKPADLAALISWMNSNNMSLVAIDFARSLSPDLLAKWPVPGALAEAYGRVSDWPALRKLAATGSWGEFDFLRHAYLARAMRGENNTTVATREWTDATKAAAAQPKLVLTLARTIYDWGWKNESIELLWQLTKYAEMQVEALRALYAYYQKGHDAPGLYRVLTRLNELDPGDAKVQNNLNQISLLLGVDLERASKRAAELYAKAPTDPGYLSTYAFSLYRKGDSKGAVAAMSRLGEQALQDPAVAAYYAIFLAATGDKQSARRFLDRGKQADLLPEEKSLLARAE